MKEMKETTQLHLKYINIISTELDTMATLVAELNRLFESLPASPTETDLEGYIDQVTDLFQNYPYLKTRWLELLNEEKRSIGFSPLATPEIIIAPLKKWVCPTAGCSEQSGVPTVCLSHGVKMVKTEARP